MLEIVRENEEITEEITEPKEIPVWDSDSTVVMDDSDAEEFDLHDKVLEINKIEYLSVIFCIISIIVTVLYLFNPIYSDINRKFLRFMLTFIQLASMLGVVCGVLVTAKNLFKDTNNFKTPIIILISFIVPLILTVIFI